MPKHASNQNSPLPMIAIIGADGSGKSTVLSSLVENYRHRFVRSIYVLDRASRKSAPGKPIRNYAQPPRSKVVSMIKIFQRALTWTIKYHLKLAFMKRTGVLIVCDHFYFLGILLDPLKYRYAGPHSLAGWIFRMIPQPDFYIFLDAPLEVLYGRKQEITREEMEQLMTRHRTFMSGIPNGYVVDAASPPGQVTAEISQKITQIIEQTDVT